MALAKKGTRRITVNGSTFRWVVSPDDNPGMAIVVESAAAPGRRLVTWISYGNVISPWLVRRAILHGLDHGWHPQERGPDLVFRFVGVLEK